VEGTCGPTWASEAGSLRWLDEAASPKSAPGLLHLGFLPHVIERVPAENDRPPFLIVYCTLNASADLFDGQCQSKILNT
jgi:hypothetical protein